MRILLLSDIHANWPALRAIEEPFDLCLFLGDLVDYGPQPVECIDWVRHHARYAVRGNHDHGTAQDVVSMASGGFKYLTAVTRPMNRERLDPERLRYLAQLPLTRAVTLAGKRWLLVHATPRDPLDEYGPPDEDFWAKRLEGMEADIVCVGHTHVPYDLTVGRARVINPGAVGLQRDGDPRASYAVWEDGQITFKRIEYAVEETVSALLEAPLPELAQKALSEVYRTGQLNGKIHPVASEPAATDD